MDVSRIFLLDKTDGWAIAGAGAILHTGNGGSSWAHQYPGGPGEKLNAVHFLGPLSGAAVGDGGLVLTTGDGGQNWAKSPAPATAVLKSVFRLKNGAIWAVGEKSTVLRSADGGANWQTVALDSVGTKTYQSVFFTNETTGFISTQNGILKTVDGGGTWQSAVPIAGQNWAYQKLHFTGDGTGWCIFNNVYYMSGSPFPTCGLIRTIDAGHTWQVATGETPYTSITDAHFFDEKNGLMLRGRDLLRTGNGGASWAALPKVAAGLANPNFLKLTALSFADSLTGAVVGDRGVISTTADGCKTWSPVHRELSRTTANLFFIDSLTGWCLGDYGTILKTETGGLAWEAQNSGVASDFMDVHFRDAAHGFAVGGAANESNLTCFSTNSAVFATEDAGAHWKKVFNFPDCGSGDGLTKMFMLDSLTGWAFGGTTMIKTTDGGANWADLGGTGGVVTGAFFFDALSGWACTGGFIGTGALLRTTDGGDFWKYFATGITTPVLFDIVFKNADTGWAVGANGTVLKTANAGISWTKQPFPAPADIHDIEVRGDEVWAVTVAGEIFSSPDDGANWSLKFKKAGTMLNRIRFLGGQNGWAVGDKGAIFRTIDGGESWAEVNSSDLYELTCVFPLPTGEVWASGRARVNFTTPAMLRSADNGANWQFLSSGTNDDLRSIFFTDKNNGWAVSRDIMHTADGGRTWLQQIGGSVYGGKTIFAVDPLTAFMPETGGLTKTADGGKSWAFQTVNPNLGFKKVVFSGKKRGWLISGSNVAASSKLYRTTDGGSSWQVGPAPPSILEDIFMIDSLHGWIATAYQNPWKTSDGGDNWTEVTSLNFLNGSKKAFFTDTLNGWVLGSGPQLTLRTADGGQSWDTLSFPGLPNGFGFSDVFATGPSDAWLCGGDNFIVKIGQPRPPVVKNELFCKGAVAGPLTAFGAGPVWFSASTGGTGSPVAPVPPTDVAGVFHWYVGQTGIGGGGCGQVERTELTVEVVDGPVIGSFFVKKPACGLPGDGIVAVATAGGTVPFQFLWSTGATTDSLFSVGPGNYSVTVTDANGCSDMAAVLVDCTTAVDGAGRPQIEVSPNPTAGPLRLVFSKSPVAVRLFNPLGQVVFEKNAPPFDLLELPPLMNGLYFLEIKMDGGRSVLRKVEVAR